MSFIFPRDSVAISDFEENKPWSQFSELIAVERTPLIELNSAYGTTELRDVIDTSNSGDVSSADGEIVLSTGTTSSSTAAVRSVATGRYQPGYAAEAGIGVRIATAPTGSQVALWGSFFEDGGTPTNGFYFGVDSTGVFVARARNGSEMRVYQNNWNVDVADGTGSSGYTIDIARGIIYQVDFTWYGYGIIAFCVIDRDPNGQQRQICVHRMSFPNETSVTNPNLPITARVINGGTTSDLTMYVGGRQYAIFGRYNPSFRVTSDYVLNVTVGTTFTPLIAFRYKPGFEDRAVRLEGFTVDPEGGSGMVIQARWNPTVSGGTYGNLQDHVAAETALESSRDMTSVSGGNVIYQDLLSSSGFFGGSKADLDSIDLPIAPEQPIVLCARTYDTADETVNALLRMKEEW